MKIIEFRGRVSKGILGAALILAIMPIIGLLSGTAFSMGLHGMNYQEASLLNNPEQYWFIIKLEVVVVLLIAIRSILIFPAFEFAYQKLLNFRDKNKLLAYAILYLIVPILVVALCLFLLAYFNL